MSPKDMIEKETYLKKVIMKICVKDINKLYELYLYLI